MPETYETHAKGIRILPGKWRPHYPWEQIAWISPPWPSQDYVWLDFPEAIFTSQGLVYLSHINPRVPSLYAELPVVEWRVGDNEVSYHRDLPNGVKFGGSVSKETGNRVALRLYLENGTGRPLSAIALQTCLFLRGCTEFAEFTLANKFVRLAGLGWRSFPEAIRVAIAAGSYSLGWRSGPKLADLPVMVAISNQAERLVAMTWGKHTLSLVGNPNHPCLHADPRFPDLEESARAEICGNITFFEGSLAEFDGLISAG